MATGACFAADERGGRFASDIELLRPIGPRLIGQPACQHQGSSKQNADKNYDSRSAHQLSGALMFRRLGDA